MSDDSQSSTKRARPVEDLYPEFSQVNKQTEDYYNLRDAIKNNDLQELRRLLASGADPNSVPKNDQGIPAQPDLIHVAIGYRHNTNQGLESIRLLLEHGANVNSRNFTGTGTDGQTPLMSSAIKRDLDLARLLLSHNADPSIIHNGMTSDQMYHLIYQSGPNFPQKQTVSQISSLRLSPAQRLCGIMKLVVSAAFPKVIVEKAARFPAIFRGPKPSC